jgi:hypothetical protein
LSAQFDDGPSRIRSRSGLTCADGPSARQGSRRMQAERSVLGQAGDRFVVFAAVFVGEHVDSGLSCRASRCAVNLTKVCLHVDLDREPRRMSVWPVAIHTRTPDEIGIIARPSIGQRCNRRRQHRRVDCARDLHPRSARELDLDHPAVGQTGGCNIRRDLHRRSDSPAVHAADGANHTAGLDEAPLLWQTTTRWHSTPATPPPVAPSPPSSTSPALNRCDDLNSPVRHVTIPMNSQMTHTLR